SNWNWIPCLALPIETLATLHFLHRPLKWIRYAIGVVIGARGDLSASRDLANDSMDYNADLPTNSVNLYYHTNDQEKQRMFPIDPRICDAHTTTSVSSSRKGSFREDVAARDGQRCIWTGWDVEDCDAVHLIPHSKSDEYIMNFTRHRGRDEGDIITNIDSIRNRILLNMIAHVKLCKNLAFLMTPNFAMGTSDIDHHAPPDLKRCTAHLIEVAANRGPNPLEFVSAPPVRIAASHRFPPDILFDAVYASSILRHFGTKIMTDWINRGWSDTFYPDGVTTAAQASYKAITDAKAATEQQEQEQALARDARAEHRSRR
ncbi:hypothetical protein EDB86DRAFT_2798832, partial [Lactarius hatsudake]